MTTKKNLIYISWDSCPVCGNCAGLEESSFDPDYAECVFDCEDVYCDECGLTGTTVVDSDTAYVDWSGG